MGAAGWMALAALAVAALTVVAFASVVRSLVRQHARERDLLVNQIMHLTGKTWTPPPAAPPAEPEFDVDRFVTSPEQLP